MKCKRCKHQRICWMKIYWNNFKKKNTKDVHSVIHNNILHHWKFIDRTENYCACVCARAVSNNNNKWQPSFCWISCVYLCCVYTFFTIVMMFIRNFHIEKAHPKPHTHTLRDKMFNNFFFHSILFPFCYMLLYEEWASVDTTRV